ncbi:unnamed protein product, partial [Rhizoctonia solani]
MASKVQAVAVPNNGAIIRRRPAWGAGNLFAQGVAGLVNVPGLKDAVSFAKEGAKSLKAPKLNDAQTRKQICSIEGVLGTTDHNPGAPEDHSPAQMGVERVESFRRDMTDIKAELEKALREKYSTKFACQNEVAQFLAQKKDQVSGRISGFCLESSIQANYAVITLLESNQQMGTKIDILSTTVADLKHQIDVLQRLLWRCIALSF